MYKRILLAIDGSEHSKRATDEAAKLAGLCGASIEIVYVADYSKAMSDVLHTQSKEDLDLARREKLLPFEEKMESFGVSFRVKILHGEPGPAIVEYANSSDVDLVVIGSRGLNTLQEMVLGSVSHKVVKRVDCPVLIVK
ncbi:universal stress protein [Cytobacillus pseudoceanisediminis]|uniref:universal stress protein n=1 Tax=Cytobacillus pseudoceanisediminis TaxID=3051614 RepID=UPI0036675D42